MNRRPATASTTTIQDGALPADRLHGLHNPAAGDRHDRHGLDRPWALGQQLPGEPELGIQSAVGFSPIAVNSEHPRRVGSTFLVGKWTHHNNPINPNTNDYTGDLNIRLFGQNPPLHYDWQLTETPNQCNNGPNQPPGTDCSDDFTWFDSQLPAQDITVGGLTYKLVILGFVTDADGKLSGDVKRPLRGRYRSQQVQDR